METRFTPGPWEVCNHGDIFSALGSDSGDGVSCDDNDGWQVAEVGIHSSFVDGQLVELSNAVRRANMRLIAAAPDGFDAAAAAYMAILQSPINEWRVDQDYVLAMLRDYIAKATNQEPEDVQNFYERKAALAKARGETDE